MSPSGPRGTAKPRGPNIFNPYRLAARRIRWRGPHTTAAQYSYCLATEMRMVAVGDYPAKLVRKCGRSCNRRSRRSVSGLLEKVLDRAWAISAVQPFPPMPMTGSMGERYRRRFARRRRRQTRKTKTVPMASGPPASLTAGRDAGCSRNWCWRSRGPGCPVAAASAAP